jgi:hypothetical protein
VSSRDRFGIRWRGVGEGSGRVVCLAGLQAVVQLAEHPAEQVPQRGGVPVAAFAAAQEVLTGR